MKYQSGTFGAIGPIGSVLDCVTASTFMPAGGVMKRLSCDEDESASVSSVHADTFAAYAPLASLVTTTSGPGCRPSLIPNGANRMRTPDTGRPSVAMVTWPLTLRTTGAGSCVFGGAERDAAALGVAVGDDEGVVAVVALGDGEGGMLAPCWHATTTETITIAPARAAATAARVGLSEPLPVGLRAPRADP